MARKRITAVALAVLGVSLGIDAPAFAAGTGFGAANSPVGWFAPTGGSIGSRFKGGAVPGQDLPRTGRTRSSSFGGSDEDGGRHRRGDRGGDRTGDHRGDRDDHRPGHGDGSGGHGDRGPEGPWVQRPGHGNDGDDGGRYDRYDGRYGYGLTFYGNPLLYDSCYDCTYDDEDQEDGEATEDAPAPQEPLPINVPPQQYGYDNSVAVEKNPEADQWIGRKLAGTPLVRLYNYDYYGLPEPRRGSYYVRYQQRDLFLVAATDREILDAYVVSRKSRR